MTKATRPSGGQPPNAWLKTWRVAPLAREGPDMIEISDQYMIATIDGQIVATARWSWHAAADGNGAWIASTHPKRLLSRARRPRP
jgi:hypothetical protein